MWIFIVIVVVGIIIAIFLFVNNRSNISFPSRYRVPAYTPAQQRIEDCVSAEDVQYQISYETRRIIANIEKSKTVIQNAIIAANTSINAAWLNSYEKVLKISTNLDENLNYYAKKNLEHSKFQYYTSLHFRSMIAADIVYREFKQIDTSFNDINKLIVYTAKTGKKSGISKSQLYKAKDAIKDLRTAFITQVRKMNQKTAKLRDKIGLECGERGRQWRTERMRRRA